MDNLRIGQQSLLGYLPALVIKNIIDKKIDIETNHFPQHYVFKTVALFADISGFTKLSEAFAKKGRIGPEFLAFSLNRYMEQLVGIIGKNGGDIFKFAGDALLVIWPETSNHELAKSCRRATQCALDIQAKLHDVEISKNKRLSIKVGIGVGEVRILVVGGQFKRCEYLSVGEALAHACDAESKATGGGQTICSEFVHELIKDNIEDALIEPSKDDHHGHGGGDEEEVKFYLINKLKGERVPIKADAYLMRTQFSSDKLRSNMKILRSFVPNAICSYLDIEKEAWSKEIRLLTIMFMLLKVDLKQTKSEEGLLKIQDIIKTVQRGLYSTRGSLNKFLMDDKGSVILAAWGLPPGSNPDDHVKAVFGALTLIKELRKLNCGANIGLTTGTCFSGVCGNIGNRREYSLLGEVVNLSARHMQKAIYWAKDHKLDFCLLIDERTKDLCQDKLAFQYVTSGELKGFQSIFDFYTPVEIPKESSPTNPFPQIRTHRNNSLFLTVAPNSQIKDPNKCMTKSMFMVGREEQIAMFNEILDRVHLQQDNEIVVIKGVIGSGKSLFIRKCLYDYFFNTKPLNQYFKGIKGNPIIFVEYQKPDNLNQPCNGMKGIFMDMYFYLSREAEKHGKRIIKTTIENTTVHVECDFIGEMLFDTGCYMHIKYIEEILEINLSSHFNFSADFNNTVNEIPHPLDIPTRDVFFEQRKYDATQEKSIKFFFSSIVINYRKYCIDAYVENIPLIIVVEDCHLIDDISCKIINRINMENDLMSTIIICTYQTPVSPLILNSADKFSKHEDLFDCNNIYLGPFFENDDISRLIKDSLKTKYGIVVETIEKHLIYLILSKSFNGIPLFILEIVENMANNNKFAQFAGNELISTYELEQMEKTQDWSEFPIPILIEKIVGALIDSLSFKEIIILKIASVIGTLFDLNKLDEFNPFNNIAFDELLQMMYSLEQRGVLEILYDSNPRYSVCKFSIPFMREILYQRLLIEQKSDIHLNIARCMQTSKFTYRSADVELKHLRMHLSRSEKTVGACMEEDDDIEDADKLKLNSLSLGNLKTYFFKELCNKLSNADNDEDKNLLKSGALAKKSDKGISWEDRYCVMSKTKFMYWYEQKNYRQNKQPLGRFNLKDISSVKSVGDYKFSKKSVFYISVSQWFKKEKVKDARGFYFAAESKEELMGWMTSLNFLCLNSYYEEFTKGFGVIHFPLSTKQPIDRRYKKKFQPLIIPKIANNMSTTMKMCLFHKENNLKLGDNNVPGNKKSKKFSTFILPSVVNLFETKEEAENPDKINFMKEFFTAIFNLGFLLFFGFCQDKIYDSSIFNNQHKISIPNFIKKNIDSHDTVLQVKIGLSPGGFITKQSEAEKELDIIKLFESSNNNLNSNNNVNSKEENSKKNSSNLVVKSSSNIKSSPMQQSVFQANSQIKTSSDAFGNKVETFNSFKNENPETKDAIINNDKSNLKSNSFNQPINLNTLDSKRLAQENLNILNILKSNQQSKFSFINNQQLVNSNSNDKNAFSNNSNNNTNINNINNNSNNNNSNNKNNGNLPSNTQQFQTKSAVSFQPINNNDARINNNLPLINANQMDMLNHSDDNDDINFIKSNYNNDLAINQKLNKLNVESDQELDFKEEIKSSLHNTNTQQQVNSNNIVNNKQYDSEEKNNSLEPATAFDKIMKKKEDLKKLSVMDNEYNYTRNNKGTNLTASVKDNSSNNLIPKVHKTNIFKKWLDIHTDDNEEN